MAIVEELKITLTAPETGPEKVLRRFRNGLVPASPSMAFVLKHGLYQDDSLEDLLQTVGKSSKSDSQFFLNLFILAEPDLLSLAHLTTNSQRQDITTKRQHAAMHGIETTITAGKQEREGFEPSHSG